MFGRGIYFADTPLKSLQYTGGKLGGCVGGDRRYMLVCDVELGNQLETTSAKSSLEPETDLRRSGVPALLGQRSFDSVAAKPSLFGLRAPEFVVYKPAQVRPRYLLAVEQVPKDSADALGSVAEKRALKARARVRAAVAASALQALEEGVVKAEAEAEAVAEAEVEAEAESPAVSGPAACLPSEEGLADERRRRLRSVREEPRAGLRGHCLGRAAVLLGGLPRVRSVELDRATGVGQVRHQSVRQPRHKPAVGVCREARLRRLQVQGGTRAPAGGKDEACAHERLANARVRAPDHVSARPHCSG